MAPIYISTEPPLHPTPCGCSASAGGLQTAPPAPGWEAHWHGRQWRQAAWRPHRGPLIPHAWPALLPHHPRRRHGPLCPLPWSCAPCLAPVHCHPHSAGCCRGAVVGSPSPMQAVVGAAFLAGGMDCARETIRRLGLQYTFHPSHHTLPCHMSRILTKPAYDPRPCIPVVALEASYTPTAHIYPKRSPHDHSPHSPHAPCIPK